MADAAANSSKAPASAPEMAPAPAPALEPLTPTPAAPAPAPAPAPAMIAIQDDNGKEKQEEILCQHQSCYVSHTTTATRFIKSQVPPEQRRMAEPTWTRERYLNEAAALRLVTAKTKIPVPRLIRVGERDGLMFLETERLAGTRVSDIGRWGCHLPPGAPDVELDCMHCDVDEDGECDCACAPRMVPHSAFPSLCLSDRDHGARVHPVLDPTECGCRARCWACMYLAEAKAVTFIEDVVLPQLAKVQSETTGIDSFVVPHIWLDFWHSRAESPLFRTEKWPSRGRMRGAEYAAWKARKKEAAQELNAHLEKSANERVEREREMRERHAKERDAKGREKESSDTEKDGKESEDTLRGDQGEDLNKGSLDVEKGVGTSDEKVDQDPKEEDDHDTGCARGLLKPAHHMQATISKALKPGLQKLWLKMVACAPWKIEDKFRLQNGVLAMHNIRCDPVTLEPVLVENWENASFLPRGCVDYARTEREYGRMFRERDDLDEVRALILGPHL